MRKVGLAFVVGVLIVLAGASAWLWNRNGAYGFNVIARRGGTYWTTVKPDAPRLSEAMRVALRPVVPPVTPGALTWREVEPGFEVADLAVLAEGREVERLLLSRIDPVRFRLVARNDPAGRRDIDQWEKALPDSVLITNGSYYGLKGTPITPFISEGRDLGPSVYDARAGAWVSKAGAASVIDLSATDWHAALKGADNAMVSYPLLIGEDGQTHVPVNSNWLANRTFIAQDRQGRILIGSTKDAFFSLTRLAAFLKAAPLDIRVALNLDGGPIACQSVRAGSFRRKLYARGEAQVVNGEVRWLRWPIDAPWAMPVVVTVEPKKAPVASAR